MLVNLAKLQRLLMYVVKLQRLALTHVFHHGSLQTEVVNSGWVDRINDPTATFQLPQACWSAPDPMQYCIEDEPTWRCNNKTGGCEPCVGAMKKACNPDLHACAAKCHHA